jgi:hypothetical protein
MLCRICFGLSLIVASLASGKAQAAPVQLFEKSIRASWVNTFSARAADGSLRTWTGNNSAIIYVSSKGRLFFRNVIQRAGVGQGGRAGETNQRDPGTRGVRFEGNRLVITRPYARGAINIAISFSPDFATCSVAATIGRLAGAPIKMRLSNGENVEIVDARTAPGSCSLQAGNALGI